MSKETSPADNSQGSDQFTPHLISVLDDYLARLKRGEVMDRQQLLRAWPDIADRLAQYLNTIDALQSAVVTEPDFQLGPASSSTPCPPTYAATELSSEIETSAARQTRRLGDYLLLRQVGRGGMGVVYEARQLSLDRRVALKVLPLAATLDPQNLQRFRTEARAAAGLHHTHIVPVYATGTADATHFYAMQFIEGCTLAELITRLKQELRQSAAVTAAHREASFHTTASVQSPADRPAAGQPADSTEQRSPPDFEMGKESSQTPPPTVPSPADSSAKNQVQPHSSQDSALRVASRLDRRRFRWAAELMVPVALALDYAHKQGITHRDIKPSNILLDETGRPYVTDFGLARIETEVTITRPGDTVGTLQYMSPERLGPRPAVVDHRADIYSLGVTLYELLTLHKAFPADNAATLQKAIVAGQILRPRQHDRSIPADLELITLKATSARPEDRYQTCQELAEDLRRFLEHRPLLARRPTITQRATRWAWKHRGLVLSSGLVLLLLTATTLVAAWQIEQARRRAVQNQDQAVSAQMREQSLRHEALLLKDRAERAEQQRTEQLWVALRAQAQSSLQSRQPGRRYATLDAVAGAAGLQQDLTLGNEQIRELRNDAISALSLTDVRLWRRWDLLSRNATIETVDFTPDMTYSIQHDGPGMSIRQVADDREVARLPASSYPLLSRFGNDLKHLALVCESETGPQLQIWDWTSQRLLFTHDATTLGSAVTRYSVDFHPLSPELAVGCEDGSVCRIGLPDGDLIRRYPTSGPPHTVRYSASGQQLAANVTYARQILVWDLAAAAADSGPVGVYECPEQTFGLAWKSDGTGLAAGCGYDIGYWQFPSGSPYPVRFLRGGAATVGAVTFQPDSQLLVSTGYSDSSRLWDSAAEKLLLTIDGHAHRFDHTGRKLAFRGNSSWGVLQLGSDEHLWRVLPTPTATVEAGCLAWLAQGRLLVVGGQQGLDVWDAVRREFLGHLDVGAIHDLTVPAGAAELLAVTDRRVLKIPVGIRIQNQSVQVRLGPAKTAAEFAEPRPLVRIAASGTDAQRIVVTAAQPNGLLSLADGQLVPVAGVPVSSTDRMHAAVSSNGNWIAWSADSQPGLHVQQRSGETVVLLPNRSGPLSFSADSRYLALGADDAVRLWDTRDWDQSFFAEPAAAPSRFAPILTIPRRESRQTSSVAFAADSALLVVTGSPGHLWLIAADSRELLCELWCPDDDVLTADLSFDPASQQLGVACLSHGFRVWNLASLRRELKQIDLHWNSPASNDTEAASELLTLPLKYSQP